MISFKLMFYCFVSGGVYLAVVTVLLEFLARRLRISRGIPEELLETTGWGWFVLNYLMEFLFLVVIPTFAYGLFSVILPLSGIRIALAATLFAFTLGAAPAIIGLSVRLRLSMPYLLFFLLSLLLKLGGALVIIGYLHAL